MVNEGSGSCLIFKKEAGSKGHNACWKKFKMCIFSSYRPYLLEYYETEMAKPHDVLLLDFIFTFIPGNTVQLNSPQSFLKTWIHYWYQ